jgi:hypothetical protein
MRFDAVFAVVWIGSSVPKRTSALMSVGAAVTPISTPVKRYPLALSSPW